MSVSSILAQRTIGGWNVSPIYRVSIASLSSLPMVCKRKEECPELRAMTRARLGEEPTDPVSIIQRGANHIQRRERRRGAPRTISHIITAVLDTQWSLPAWDMDDMAMTDENESIEATSDAGCHGPIPALALDEPTAKEQGDGDAIPYGSRAAIIESVGDTSDESIPIVVVAGHVPEDRGQGNAMASASHTENPCRASISVAIPHEAAHRQLYTILDEISVYRNVSYESATWESDIVDFGRYTFLRVQFNDWGETCRRLSSDWETSWHGALSPYILNMIVRNGIYPATLPGAGQTMGLFHSNNRGLHYPFKYAYPSQLMCSGYMGAGSEANLDAIDKVVPLYHSLVELKVKPMTWAKTTPKHKWHVTKNDSIQSEIRLSAALFCVYTGPRSMKHVSNMRGHICMTNGRAFNGLP
jgi:hypothetical protein